jgi:hypothetical protein
VARGPLTKIIDTSQPAVMSAAADEGILTRAGFPPEADVREDVPLVRRGISYLLEEGADYMVAARPRLTAMRTNAAKDSARILSMT